jgi:acetyltransferase
VFDEHHLAIGAAIGSELVGIAHLAIERDRPRAEIAILVEDTHQRRGIATALLSESTSYLFERGIEQLEALTLPGNAGMETLVQRLGQPLRLRREAGLVRVVIDLRQLAEPVVTARA